MREAMRNTLNVLSVLAVTLAACPAIAGNISYTDPICANQVRLLNTGAQSTYFCQQFAIMSQGIGIVPTYNLIDPDTGQLAIGLVQQVAYYVRDSRDGSSLGTTTGWNIVAQPQKPPEEYNQSPERLRILRELMKRVRIPTDPADLVSPQNTFTIPNRLNGQGGVRGGITIPGYNLTEASPDYFGYLVDIPIGYTAMLFDFQALRPGNGDHVALYIDNEIAWSALGSDLGVMAEAGYGLIDISQYSGRTTTFNWVLHNSGTADSEFFVGSNLTFTNRDFFETVDATISEPSGITLIGLGIAGLGFAARRRAQADHSSST